MAKKQRNIKSWDQQNYVVITGFCYIRPLYNEVPLYQLQICWRSHVTQASSRKFPQCWLTLSRPISLHSRKPPGPHCFEPFTCNVYRSFQPHNMHMCNQFWGKVSTAKIFYDYQTYLWFVWFFLQNEHELKIEEIFLPWKAKHTGKIVAP